MKFIGIGDNVVDRYINKRIMFPGGNAVNFAVYAKQCGEDAAYLGLIADDREGRLVYDSLHELGVELTASPLQEEIATERCDVTLEEGDRVFIGYEYGERGEEAWKPLTLQAEHLDYLKAFDVVHCGCYAAMEDEIHKLKELNALKTYDFSSEEEFRTDAYLEKVCPYIDVALFSAQEMNDEQQRQVREKAAALGTKMVLITDGVRGQKLWYHGREYQGSVKKVEPVDTMGAGDSFFTAFVVGVARAGFGKGGAVSDEDIQEAFRYAADFSAKTCMVEGAFGFGTGY